MPPDRSRCSRSRRATAGADPLPIKTIGGDSGSGSQFVRRRIAGARLAAAGAITTLIVAGGVGVRDSGEMRQDAGFVRAMAKRGVRVASVCSGAYILAEAGLLDGRRATTHWQRTRDFLAAYPKVKLEPDRIFIRDGNIWTSAGISAGIDLALAMVGGGFRRRGRAGDRASARALSSPQRWPVAVFIAIGIESADGRFGPLLAWAREHLDEPLTVEVWRSRPA